LTPPRRPHARHGRDRDPGLPERRLEPPLQAAAGLDHHQRTLLARQPGDQACDAALVAIEGDLLATRQDMHIQARLADIDPDEAFDLFQSLAHHHPRMRACSPIDCSG
jgi:hypothetical protein